LGKLHTKGLKKPAKAKAWKSLRSPKQNGLEKPAGQHGWGCMHVFVQTMFVFNQQMYYHKHVVFDEKQPLTCKHK
jgi:hypothetical protein